MMEIKNLQRGLVNKSDMWLFLLNALKKNTVTPFPSYHFKGPPSKQIMGVMNAQ